MISLTQGNIFEADVETLVNPVNCEGVMGKGLALQFKKAFPENFKAYARACYRGEVQPGRMFVFATSLVTNPKFIINFPTKRKWRKRSQIEDIAAGLATLVGELRRLKVSSVAVPPLGCGLGGLDWRKVRPLMEHAFANLPDVHVMIFEPVSTPDVRRTRERAF